ncbi:MAG: HlyD family type I secretion periplasmic adaptor subunit [Alphaproteobacteria bacterium]|nr:HlyD family type I secretion periplasmic adaptor subunit [Alphaproteobacteria bacterium]
MNVAATYRALRFPVRAPAGAPRLDDMRGPVAGSLLIVAALVLTLGVWGGTAPLAGAIVTSGVVRADGNWREVQHPRGGRVTALLVRDGALVEAGEPLVRLDPERDEGSLAVLKARMFAARASLARLNAERDRAEAIAFPDDLLEVAGDTDVAEAMRSEEALFASRARSFRSQRAVIEERLAQGGKERAGIEARLRAVREQSDILRQQMKSLDELASKGFAPTNRVRSLSMDLAGQTAKIAEAESALAQALREEEEAKLELAKLDAERDAKIVSDLAEAQATYTDFKERYAVAAYDLEGLTVRAPIAGRVINLAVNTVGAVVQPGETILGIVPADEPLVVEGTIAPKDRDFVAPGQAVEVRLSALSPRDPPRLEGRLAYISPDAVSPAPGQPPRFLVRAEIAEDAVAELGPTRLVPGLPAELYLLTGDRTALDYLLSPLVNAIAHAWRER